ncbi:hypothetical protein WN51_00371 [Melipona quadrifasciata]|uniref:Uncharacterized protein n=1 Tax=Melipona quadrifasciata TaxID=166423 RepID=A0A0M9A349_9HYME|nr:hypothetical protein WN51_00371 [Melipona quadrifasciata]
MSKPQLTNIIKQKINRLHHEITEDKLNNISICTFDDTNTSNNPNTEATPPNIFTIYNNKLKLTFEKLNNKKSSSYDNVPNVALKDLPPLYITQLHNNFQQLPKFILLPCKMENCKSITPKKKERMPLFLRRAAEAATAGPLWLTQSSFAIIPYTTTPVEGVGGRTPRTLANILRRAAEAVTAGPLWVTQSCFAKIPRATTQRRGMSVAPLGNVVEDPKMGNSHKGVQHAFARELDDRLRMRGLAIDNEKRRHGVTDTCAPQKLP